MWWDRDWVVGKVKGVKDPRGGNGDMRKVMGRSIEL